MLIFPDLGIGGRLKYHPSTFSLNDLCRPGAIVFDGIFVGVISCVCEYGFHYDLSICEACNASMMI